ncbi:MAG TPA: hypothetical protein ENL08_01275, partial [Bacteroidetes bacterium]|nr:hypothetical protein [Bacteroidota bacterium]
ADYVLFRDPDETRCVVNLGGYCNVTILAACKGGAGGSVIDRAGLIKGRDVCACNSLLDGIAVEAFHQPFDENGDNAARGVVRSEPLAALSELLQEQSSEGRSLGSGDELHTWLKQYQHRYDGRDLARTACAAIAGCITAACGSADRLIVAGGGVENRTLMSEIRSRAGVPVETTDEYGVPARYREAAAMAVLGALCRDRIPVTLPGVTGVETAPVSGCWMIP